MISGSWPGSIYFFRGVGSGHYAPAKKLLGVDGNPVNQGAASAVSVVDWDRDGDLDLVVGNIESEVVCVINEGIRDGQPAFGKPAKFILDVPGGDAGPSVVDWNGDGKEDLLLGSQTGAVWLALDMKAVRNSSMRGEADSLIPLVPPLPSRAQDAPLLREPLERPQTRAKPTACDWNGDGLLDLLVGDFATVHEPEPKLSADEKAERARVEAESSSKSKVLSTLAAKLLDRARYENGVKDHRRTDDEALEEKIEARRQELECEDAEYQRLHAAIEKLDARLRQLSATRSNHGYVWVYLRRPKSASK